MELINRDMVFTACATWFHDWVSAHPADLVDVWDLSHWITTDMREATEVFLEYAFHTERARNDAILILRGLYYEYYLYRQQLAIKHIRAKPDVVDYLLHAPQTPQKSSLWHSESRNMLSGHEFGSIIVGGIGERNAVIAKKCIPQQDLPETDSVSQTVFLTPENGQLSPFKWGWRYEPVARQLFETHFAFASINDTLGRIRHPTLPRLGASPDGLITSGPRCGRLLEIKCPISRQLDGNIPLRYYCQMQLQAEVCQVDAVDYFEVQFGILRDAEDALRSKLPYIGKVCVIGSASASDSPYQEYTYAYSPLFRANEYDALVAWKPDTEGVILEASSWYVKDYYTTTVVRNERWWTNVGYVAYIEFWKEVDEARVSGKYKSQALFVDSGSDGTQEEEEPEPEPEQEVESETPTGWIGADSESGSETDSDLNETQ